MGRGGDEDAIAELTAELQRSFKTWIGQPHSLISADGNWQRWLDKEKGSIPWKYWNRYRTHLLSLGWAPTVVDSVDLITDQTLSHLNSPAQQGQWDRRGMVVGHVQSGKTSNYIGLICKAADAGYKVIIVLTGFHNSLRTQTQIRLEEGFIGYDKHSDLNRPSLKAQLASVSLIRTLLYVQIRLQRARKTVTSTLQSLEISGGTLVDALCYSLLRKMHRYFVTWSNILNGRQTNVTHAIDRR